MRTCADEFTNTSHAVIEEVVRTVRTDFDLIAGRTTWEQALAEVPSRLISGAEDISVSGTLVQWHYNTHGIEAEVPDMWSPVDTQKCTEA